MSSESERYERDCLCSCFELRSMFAVTSWDLSGKLQLASFQEIPYLGDGNRILVSNYKTVHALITVRSRSS